MDYHHYLVGAPLGNGAVRRVQPGWLPVVHLVNPSESGAARSTFAEASRAVLARLGQGGWLKCQLSRSH